MRVSRGPITNEQVVFGETTFKIRRALPIEAFNIFESLRPGLAEVSDAVGDVVNVVRQQDDDNRDALIIKAALKIIGKLPQEIVEIGMHKMMRHVSFQRKDTGAPLIVANDPASAFKGMTVFNIYELLIRAFCVNFMESFDDLQLILGDLQEESLER